MLKLFIFEMSCPLWVYCLLLDTVVTAVPPAVSLSSGPVVLLLELPLQSKLDHL